MDSKTLINQLTKLTKNHIKEVESFKKLSLEMLNYKSSENSWSILECVEHLNRYGDYYIPEIRKQITKRNYQKSTTFKSGLLGNYFSKSMLPKRRLNKMETSEAMNPKGSGLSIGTLDTFINQQNQILAILQVAPNLNLTKIKTGVSIAPWIKIRLGDTLRVVIYHNERHIYQANNIIKK